VEGGDCFVPDPESNSGLVSRNDTFVDPRLKSSGMTTEVDSRLRLCPSPSIRYSSRMTGREIASQEPVLSESKCSQQLC
jgi:hypothetical protein